MPLIELERVSRIYDIDGVKKKRALSDFTFSFPEHGLFAVTGKSGCGKSTLLNLLGILDTPSEGVIRFHGRRYSSFRKKQLFAFHNQDVGFVYQHYNLLEEHDVLFNVTLPLLIRGMKKKEAEEKAIRLLHEISFREELFHQRASDLSGGEKQRIAILRAVIGEPSFLLCDEPTGALDTENSLRVMELLREVSKERLVIVVSHNEELVREYADRIIHMEEGKIREVVSFRKIEGAGKENALPVSRKRHDDWTPVIFRNNFRKRGKRNIISALSLSIGLIGSFLIFGFSNGALPSVRKMSLRLFDFGSATLASESSFSVNGSAISIVRMTRPSEEEMKELGDCLDPFATEPNADYLFPSYQEVGIGEAKTSLYLSPVLHFSEAMSNTELITYGRMANDSLSEVLINQTAYQQIRKETGIDILGGNIRFSTSRTITCTDPEDAERSLSDTLVLDFEATVTGVVTEMGFLSTPKVFYSYSALMDLLEDTPLSNLSSRSGETVSWYSRLVDAGSGEELSSYSRRIFLKDYQDYDALIGLNDILPEPYAAESSSLTIRDAMIGLVQSSAIGMDVFLVIALLGTLLILGIVSFSSYSEDRKKSAVLTSFGAEEDAITNIYLYESLFTGILSLASAFLLSPLLELGINGLVESLSGLTEIIRIPFLSFSGLPFFFPFLVTVITLTACILSTYFPICFSKKISLKEELSGND